MKWEVKVWYVRFRFETAEEAMKFAEVALAAIVPDKDEDVLSRVEIRPVHTEEDEA